MCEFPWNHLKIRRFNRTRKPLNKLGDARQNSITTRTNKKTVKTTFTTKFSSLEARALDLFR